MRISLKRGTPYITQLNVLHGQFKKLATDIENCIDSIDEAQPESARSDLCLILQELKGEEE